MVDLCGNNFDLKSELLWLRFHEKNFFHIYVLKQYFSDICFQIIFYNLM